MACKFLCNLIPPRRDSNDNRPLLSVLASLTFLQWALFFVGWLAWTTDALDFFAVSLSVNALTVEFHRSVHAVTTAITLTLLFRSLGALIFGILSDRFGRKWPLIANLLLVCLLELGSGFAQNFRTFLALRSLFGIGMGGIWGMATSTALENLPVEARGLASGVLQQGYAVGYLLAACINLRLVPETKVKWRSLFFTAAGISLFAAIFRACLPESEVFRQLQKSQRSGATVTTREKSRIFLRNVWEMLRRHWALCIYAVLLMSGFNFLSHGSQDLYPTYLEVTKGFSPHDATIATIIGNCGAIAGGIFAGTVSQYIGRRLTIILSVIWVAAFIPLWIIPSSFSGLAAGAFWLQFSVQGAWGVIPIQLSELSPPGFRATFTGLAYQLGNMVSAASAQIEATGGDHLKTTIVKNGVRQVVPDYATVQGIFIGCVSAFVIFITIVGPENHGSHFENHKVALEDAVLDQPISKAPSRHSMDDEIKEKRLATA